MKYLQTFLILISAYFYAQDIRSVQLFNPQTNDETPVIGFNEQLILRFDDLSNSRTSLFPIVRNFLRAIMAFFLRFG